MKKVFLTSNLILIIGISFGQLKSPIKELFYGINLIEPRTVIYDQLASDKRFLQKGYIATDSLSPFYHREFHGLSLDKGLLEQRADSIEVSLNWLKISNQLKNGKYEDIDNLIFVSKNYFSSIDKAKKEYDRILDLLVKTHSDTSHQLGYFGFPIERTRFNFRKPAYQVHIELFKIDALHSELRFSFVRKE